MGEVIIMTYSIIALDKKERMLGIAVASGSIAVGSRVPWARRGVGGVVTQAYTNPSLGPIILDSMERGKSPPEALKEALDKDPEPDMRQVAVLSWSGGMAVHEGAKIPKGHGVTEGESCICIGNLLSTKDVVEAMREAFQHTETSLYYRLLNALEAGHEAGGDAREDRSAALIIVGDTEYLPFYDRIIDLRVDYAKGNPVKYLYGELKALMGR